LIIWKSDDQSLSHSKRPGVSAGPEIFEIFANLRRLAALGRLFLDHGHLFGGLGSAARAAMPRLLWLPV
jgi:hypothetical protein